MDTKTKVLLFAGVGLGAYLLYRQTSANPYSFLPSYNPYAQQQLQQQQNSAIPVLATGGAVGLNLLGNLLPSAASAGSSLLDTIGGWFGGTSGGTYQPVMMPGSGVLLPEYQSLPAFDFTYHAPDIPVQPFDFSYGGDQAAGSGVLLPEFW